MPWLYLLLAGVCEMAWPLGFKYTNGFRSNYPAIGLTIAIGLLSFWLLSQATYKGIPIGTAYAVWTGLGATGTAILGILLFDEPRDLLRLSCLTLIILGVLGLKFLSPTPPAAPPANPLNTST
ncbi:MAG TPA: multidrug efflux SMR transporter [Tepidisphaeraceae bacterium]|jgi:quaternary ammonium compound-resistance protein SugE|nr:multidrug efflux SMR transporter [Tepidisphaeraceae bacterium]